MKYITKRALGCALLFVVMFESAHAKPVSSPGDPVVIAVPNHIAPYVYDTEQAGIEENIIDYAILLSELPSFKLLFTTYRRAEIMLDKKEVDAALNIGVHLNVKGYYSEPLLYFKNIAVTLSSSNIHINSIDDLSQYSVLGFERAKQYLGESYKQAVSRSTTYDEVINQYAQIKHLFDQHTQVIVLEQRIFDYYLHQYLRDHEKQAFTIHDIFEPLPRHLIFVDEHKRDQFNEGLARLKASPQYMYLLNGDSQEQHQP